MNKCLFYRILKNILNERCIKIFKYINSKLVKRGCFEVWDFVRTNELYKNNCDSLDLFYGKIMKIEKDNIIGVIICSGEYRRINATYLTRQIF